ncbi:NUDIX hydrolase [Streptomyces microflavus]|uniref:NUDIX hydrolase n=1 Tax=Streptomyces microflavus TaxID=1919 RepID=UPI002DD8466F|nr:NUDIX hydrolase [Streptomyces microflavus]WSA62150.1 NUDIX hydrolase [Streptomyces microflavus]
MSGAEEHRVREGTILAAGCVLWRRAPGGGGVELAIVYRPKWDDWSHPKGKLKRGETAREAAVREVLEETGMACDLGSELPTTRYVTEGRPKEVRYWAAEATSGSFTPNREVTAVRWMSPTDALEQLTQERDKWLVTVLLGTERLPGTSR